MDNRINEPVVDHLLTFVKDPNSDEIFMHIDVQGLDFLIGELQEIREGLVEDRFDHDHFFTPDWAGWQLSNIMPEFEKKAGSTLIHHLKIYGWSDGMKKQCFPDAL